MAEGFTIFASVNTVYGPGFIEQIRETDYVVKLTGWQLAQGQSPTLYLQKESIKLIPSVFPGVVISTTYGPARLEKIRPDNMFVARPINWFLANNTTATLNLHPTSVSQPIKPTQTPGFLQGDEVMTVYGQGFVEAVRDTDLIIKLRNWKLAQGQSPTCHLSAASCVKIPGFSINQCAKTVWGIVRILEIRRDGTHVCEALHWKLADGKSPRFHLEPHAFALLSLKP